MSFTSTQNDSQVFRQLGPMRPVPPLPPVSVREEIALAAARVDELASSDRELHFVTDEVTGRVIVEVRDLRGALIRVISGVEALDVMFGLSDA